MTVVVDGVVFSLVGGLSDVEDVEEDLPSCVTWVWYFIVHVITS